MTASPHAPSAISASTRFGFAFEKYDPIGRLRDKDLGGLAVDVKVKSRMEPNSRAWTVCENYLLTKKKDVVLGLFCRRLLGYAVGRAVTVADQPLIDEMVADLGKNDGRLSAAVQAIVGSPQFRSIRGGDYKE